MDRDPQFSPPPPGLDRRRLLLGAAAAVGLAAAGGVFGYMESRPSTDTEPGAQEESFDGLPELEVDHEVDLIKSGNWSNVPGLAEKDGALHASRTDLAVLMLDTPGRPPAHPKYEPNPPINLYGTHIEAEKAGNVGFTARLQDVKGPSTLSFLSAPSVRYDELIERMPGIDVTVDGDTVSVKLFGEGSNLPIDEVSVALHAWPDGDVHLALSQVGNETHINVNGVKTKLGQSVLQKQTWFGIDADATIAELHAYPVGDNSLKTVDMREQLASARRSPNGLASIVEQHDRRKLVGTAIDLAELAANPAYADFVVQNFNLVETENLAKFQALQPEQGIFEFAELDALVDFADEHDIAVHGHALMFTEAYPQWLWDTLSNPATTRDQAIQLLEDHISTVVSRYDGQHGHGAIKYWDVVNEWFDPENWAEPNAQSIWYQKIGPEAAAIAFQAAHKANPNAILCANDWGGETDTDRRDAMVNWAISLKQQGVPIHVLGFQAHFDEDTLNDSGAMDMLYSGDLERTFATLGQAGLLVRVSEATVAENGDPQTQGDVYGMLMRAAMAPNSLGINFWGAINSSLRYAYSTADAFSRDPGDDAPAVQGADGAITWRPAVIAALQQSA
jgi:endo-1,4-beta-xylanase